MRKDFTLKAYNRLLDALQKKDYAFHTYAEAIEHPESKFVVLRHDVDKLPANSLAFAKIQYIRGIKGTYYFRMHRSSFDEKIISQIHGMGHEIGYHYETMDSCNGDIDEAYDEFRMNLEKFRDIVPVETISMHGSPLSQYDNRQIWEKYDYKKLGIKAEPYFDLDFNDIFYVTDTGRRWNGHNFNIRDKAAVFNPLTNSEFLKLNFRATEDLIYAIESRSFPGKAMLNFHPQRWNDDWQKWVRGYIWQNVKNQGKRILLQFKANQK